MKNRINIAVVASLAVLGGVIGLVARNWTDSTDMTSAPVTSSRLETPSMAERIEPAPVTVVPQNLAATVAPRPTAPIAQPVSQDPSRHIAEPGETVSSMASDLLGKDTRDNRDAIIDANPSLQANPDKLLAGKSYHIPSADQVLARAHPVADSTVAPPVEVTENQPQPTKVLKYTAATGDTVSNLAGAFLGNGDQAHQDKIISANPSLQANPDRVLAGTVYRIPAPQGLSASAQSLEPQPVTTPTTQPDEDQVVAAGSPRSLRYTARAGDTVTTLAIQLLGSDTPEMRDAIINDNPVLKQNPDRVIAGQTYWIPAPTSSAQNP